MSPLASSSLTSFTALSPAGINAASIRRWTLRAKRRLGLRIAINVVTIPPNLSHRLNAQYRKKHRPTNVLSFRLQDPVVGEVLLCPPVIRHEAKLEGTPYQSYFRRLLEHGLIHLLGVDHRTTAEQRRWTNYERRLS